MKELITFTLLCLISSLLAQTEAVAESSSQKYQAGLHYEILNPAWQTGTEDPVVYEFFSYMCPGCNAFEPYMEELSGQLKEKQTIIRVPVAFYAQWEPHAKAYHALSIMGELERVHKPLFEAIHQYKVPLRTLDDIGNWLAKSFGIEKSLFMSTAKSFAVDTQIRKSQQMAQAMGIGRVPTLVVNGKYKPKFDQLKTPDNILGATVSLLNQ